MSNNSEYEQKQFWDNQNNEQKLTVIGNEKIFSEYEKSLQKMIESGLFRIKTDKFKTNKHADKNS